MRRTILLVLTMWLLTGTLCHADDYERMRRYDMFFHEALTQRYKNNADASFDLLRRCIELNPEASEAYYFLAHYYEQIKQKDVAKRYFQKAAELQPDNAHYQEILAQAYIEMGEYAPAIDVYERLYAANKEREDLLEVLYRLYVREKNYEKAIEKLTLMEQIDGKSEQLSYTKSNLYNELGRPEEAIGEMKALSDQYPNDLNYKAGYADMLVTNDREAEALAIYRDILREEPQNIHALVSLRAYYSEQHDSVRADSITRVLLFSPSVNSADRIKLLGNEITENEKAQRDSTRILQLFSELLAQPKVETEVAMLCAAYMTYKQMPRDSIVKPLEQALAIAPDNEQARLQLLQFAWESGDDDRIIELCQAGRQYNPDVMAFYYFLGTTYYRKERYADALETFRNGISVINENSSPDIASDFYALYGDLLHQEGDHKAAFEAYDSCLQWKPDNIGCLNNYAYFLSELDQELDRAEKMSLLTIQKEPKNPTYLDTYAWVLFKQQRYAEARVYIDQAIQNDSLQNGTLLEHGGDIYFFCGDLEGALRQWEKALLDDPDNKLLQRKIKRKKYLKK